MQLSTKYKTNSAFYLKYGAIPRMKICCSIAARLKSHVIEKHTKLGITSIHLNWAAMFSLIRNGHSMAE